jgi:hypothetical protein
LPSISKAVKLKYFPLMHEQHARSYRVWANAELSISELRIHFKLEAAGAKEFRDVILAAQNPAPKRVNELWKETCFECFIPLENSKAYLEFNGSPSGDWNWYSFIDYREGMKEFQVPPEAQPRQTSLTMSEKQIESEWVLPLIGMRLGFLSTGEGMSEVKKIGLASVLNTSVATTYWAVAHEGVKPDFHHPSGFRYSL